MSKISDFHNVIVHICGACEWRWMLLNWRNIMICRNLLSNTKCFTCSLRYFRFNVWKCLARSGGEMQCKKYIGTIAILGVIPCTQRKSVCVALKNKFSDAILHISKKKLNALFIWSKKTFLRFCGTLITSNRWFLWLDRASLKHFFSDSIHQNFTGFMRWKWPHLSSFRIWSVFMWYFHCFWQHFYGCYWNVIRQKQRHFWLL